MSAHETVDFDHVQGQNEDKDTGATSGRCNESPKFVAFDLWHDEQHEERDEKDRDQGADDVEEQRLLKANVLLQCRKPVPLGHAGPGLVDHTRR